MKSVRKQVLDEVIRHAVDPLAEANSHDSYGFPELLSDLANEINEPLDLISAYVFNPLGSFFNLEDDSFDIIDDNAFTRDTASTFGAHIIRQEIQRKLRWRMNPKTSYQLRRWFKKRSELLDSNRVSLVDGNRMTELWLEYDKDGYFVCDLLGESYQVFNMEDLRYQISLSFAAYGEGAKILLKGVQLDPDWKKETW